VQKGVYKNLVIASKRQTLAGNRQEKVFVNSSLLKEINKKFIQIILRRFN